MTPLRQRLIEKLSIRNYSERTIEIYVWWVAKFAKFFGRSPDLLGAEEVHAFQVSLRNESRTSWSAFNQAMAALRFLYREVLERPEMLPRLRFMRRERKLPVVLAPEEVASVLALATPPRVRVLLMTIYACGLRLGEAIRLQPGDIDSKRMVIHIRRAKGHKDRYVPLATTLLLELRAYWRAEHPKVWLFPSPYDGSRPVEESCVQKAIRKAARRAGITKTVTPRTLRHCFATHSMEDGTGLRLIQEALGHRSLTTTQLYTHVSAKTLAKMRSPLDTLPPPRRR